VVDDRGLYMVLPAFPTEKLVGCSTSEVTGGLVIVVRARGVDAGVLPGCVLTEV